MACPEGKGISTGQEGPLLADVLRKNPDLIEQLALCLDREMRLISNWKHLSWELKVDGNVIKSLEQYSDFSPTIRLFEYLEVTQPDLTIQQIKQALLDIRRNDLVSLLTTKAGCVDSEIVKKVITSPDVVAPRVGLLDDLALALDERSKVLGNWSGLAIELGVPRKTFKQFERRSTQSPTGQLFEYLEGTHPQMTLKSLKDALELMNKNNLLKILRDRKLADEVLLKDIMIPGSELLQTVADELNIDDLPWTPNWRRLAYHLKIPSNVYQEFDGSTAGRKSPTKEMLQFLVQRTPNITLIDIVEALEKIQRNDAIQIITQQFPETVDHSLERLGRSFNNNLIFDESTNADSTDAKMICTPRRTKDAWTSGSFVKQEDLKQPGHCGSLPDRPNTSYVLKGRDNTCEQIITSLMSNKAVEVVAPPGYGKTSVVVEAAHRLIARGNFVAYVNPRGVACVEDLGSRIIEALGEVPGENTVQETLLRFRSLKANNVVLIIENLDNLLHLESQKQLESSFPRTDECCDKMRGHYKKDDFLTFLKEIGKVSQIHLVLTSRETNDFLFPIELIELQPLSDEDSFALFKERDKSLEEATVKKLVNICGGIPLIICTVLSLLKKRNPKNLTRRLSNCTPLELIRELSPDFLPDEDRIGKCLQVCFRRLSQDNQDVLVNLSTFPHRFTQEQFYAVFKSSTSLDLETCLDSLKHSSLLRFERESCYFCIHPFIRKFCSAQLQHREAKSLFIRYYSDLVVSLSKRFLSPNSKSAVEQYRNEKENIREATVWCEDEHPDLHQGLKDSEYCIDAFNKAAVFLAKVMRKQEFQSIFCKLSHHCRYDLERHSACLTAIGMQIVLSCTCTPKICSRAWHRATKVLSRANDIQTSLGTVDDATRAQCLSKLGFCFVREGRGDDGFEYLDQALVLRRKRFEQTAKDKDKVMLAACHNDLAASLMLQRKHMAAIETRLAIVLPVYEAILGNHPFVATTLSWIAKSYHELGDYDNAIKFASQALDIRESLLGRHQETARSYHDLGVALLEKEDYRRALEHLEHAAELQEEVLDTHEELILTRQAMAVVLKELGQDEEAEKEIKRAGECAQRLDSLDVPIQILRIHEEKGWQKTDPVSISSTQGNSST